MHALLLLVSWAHCCWLLIAAAEGTYSLEAGFLEMLLQSEHRILDPEEADFFYVPVFTSCFIYPVRWATLVFFCVAAAALSFLSGSSCLATLCDQRRWK